MNFVRGKWSWPKRAEEIASINPADHNDRICVAPNSDAEEIDRAVKAAEMAFDAWKRTPAPVRSALIARAGQILSERKEALGKLILRECGKPLQEGLGDVQEAIDMAALAAGEGRRLYGETVPSELPHKLCMTFREPVGVCGLITPWNFPIAVPAWKMFHALICGNAVVFKPSEVTPQCAVEFVRILEEAGMPAGIVNLVHGRGQPTGEALVEHPGVRLISFTGSTVGGQAIASRCAVLGKRVALELGGKNAQIVMDDADLDLAIEGALWGAFGTAGQRCTSTSRLILHNAIHDHFVDRLCEAAKGLKMPPLATEAQFGKTCDYVAIGKEEGATLRHGGAAIKGWFFQPTIFIDVTPKMRLFREEIFGPVLSVIRVNSLDEAVAMLNASQYGLSSSLYTRDINQALQAMRAIESGIVYINGPTIGAEVQMPFGGIKWSGNGGREAGKTGLDIFTEWKTVYIDYSGRLQKAQIDTEEKT